jgi:hypothetical protein
MLDSNGRSVLGTGNKIDAIASAKTNGFIQDEALANELAAKFYLEWGKEQFAAIYMQAAYRVTPLTPAIYCQS